MFGLSDIFATPTFLATFWYMGLAQILIWIMPLQIYIYAKFGPKILMVISLLPITIKFSYVYLKQYMFCIALGIICVDRDILVRIADRKIIKNSSIVNKILKFILYLLILYVLTRLRQSKTFDNILLPIWDGIISVILISFLFEYINKLYGISAILQFLGKHSMNIFLIHNFIRIVWYYDFTYSFQNWILIVLVLLAISLIISIIIELLKRLIGFNKIVAFVQEKYAGKYV